MHLGLDFGTSGARTCVVDEAETIVHDDRHTYPNGALQTPLAWREALHALLKRLPAAVSAELKHIAIAATSSTVLLCDEELEPISPALLYSDARAQKEAEYLKQIAPTDHIVCSATSGLAKFLWLTQHTDLSNSAHFLHQADWLAALLTGMGGVSDYHNALKTGYDVERLCWPDWMLHLPHAHLLPQVVAPRHSCCEYQPSFGTTFQTQPGVHCACRHHRQHRRIYCHRRE